VLNKSEIRIALIDTDGNFTRAAHRFDMTDNALRKWCKKYHLPTRSKEWKELLRERAKA
jgi:transposase-like protein